MVIFLENKHRIMKKSFETEMSIDGKKLPLNNFVQETIGNIMVGFLKSLKWMETEPETIEVKINGYLHQPMSMRMFTQSF